MQPIIFTKQSSTLDISKLEDEKQYAIREYSPPRNSSQNAKYHVLLTFVSKESGNDHDFLHEMMKKKFLSKKKLVKLAGKRNYVTKIGSTTRLSEKRFSEYYSLCEQFFAEVGYILPPYDSPEYLSLLDQAEFFDY